MDTRGEGFDVLVAIFLKIAWITTTVIGIRSGNSTLSTGHTCSLITITTHLCLAFIRVHFMFLIGIQSFSQWQSIPGPRDRRYFHHIPIIALLRYLMSTIKYSMNSVTNFLISVQYQAGQSKLRLWSTTSLIVQQQTTVPPSALYAIWYWLLFHYEFYISFLSFLCFFPNA